MYLSNSALDAFTSSNAIVKRKTSLFCFQRPVSKNLNFAFPASRRIVISAAQSRAVRRYISKGFTGLVHAIHSPKVVRSADIDVMCDILYLVKNGRVNKSRLLNKVSAFAKTSCLRSSLIRPPGCTGDPDTCRWFCFVGGTVNYLQQFQDNRSPMDITSCLVNGT